ncbi:IS30 family transposase/transposase-like protein [Demequina lutea]|uniref:IS30 family transposase/transposase-like protein n=1 Tax=Demequina lutea TaxID=431489 RepID=A0A7Y9ZE33_9MICO|nr:IS30 family transposase/transposase-like protein [Demequina lutea]
MAGKKYTEVQKEEFFRLLDKGGTVRTAARAAGVHEDAGYNWLRNTGLTMQRAAPRTYSPELKAEFLRLVRERQIISTVARELGIHKPTAYAWARKAGISTSEARRVNPRKEEFLRLRAGGLTRAQARARVGADARSATDWDKGITIINRGRVYPDGRVVRYSERDNGGVPERRSRAIGGSIDLNVVEKVIHPRYLSVTDRELLQDLHRSGLSIRTIATQMRRSPSTISRELTRNTVATRGYLPHTAHRLSVTRRARPREAKLVTNARLRRYVQAKLNTRWSPQQISQRLIKDFPNDPEMRVSPETIYQTIYVYARGELTRELAKQLRRGRAARKPHKRPDVRRPRFVEPMNAISQRPDVVHSRDVPGHWEGDLIIGALGGSAIATLVERTTRFVMLGHLGRERSAEAVRDSLITTVQDLPASLRGTLTWDQGAEMAEHRAFSLATDFDVYFADPGSPWQRGSNENTNGLLEWSPKVGHRI